ncbi:MAG: DNA cytosine methyltransferase [Kofleriaceae bacterium]|nr:DNA cytosine methyltransferase [Kofleriaceae bacterium]MBP9166538.1 DNA cytosine methyltransferase [Kofleriaceae bacterium]
MTALRAIELFAGAGGMTLGVENAGFSVMCAVENDPIHARTHSQNFQSCRVLVGDVGKQTGADLRATSGLSRTDELHLLFGGPPCQGFSVGGHRNPRDPRNVGILEFARLVRELRPLYFIMENVRGILMSQMSDTLSMFLGEISQAGYDVVGPVQTLDAADFSVPQNRARVFFLGYRYGCTPPTYPERRRSRVTVGEALADIPPLEAIPELYEQSDALVKLGPPSHYSARLRDKNMSPTSYRLTACQLTRHSAVVRERFRRTKRGAQEPVSRFIRLSNDAQSTTLRAGTDITRGRFTAPRPIHPDEHRCITVREAARLHSFPDAFQFAGTIWHGFRQVGNAVPPLLAEVVALQVKRALAG